LVLVVDVFLLPVSLLIRKKDRCLPNQIKKHLFSVKDRFWRDKDIHSLIK